MTALKQTLSGLLVLYALAAAACGDLTPTAPAPTVKPVNCDDVPVVLRAECPPEPTTDGGAR